MLMLVVALVAMVALLAFLQYRWLGEVSQAERERMQASLKTAVSNFSQEFDREITRAYMNFQMDARTLVDRDWSSFAQRYDQWIQTAPYPQLVSDILLVEPDANGNAQLLRFNPSAAQFAAASWPAHLEDLRSHFTNSFQDKDVEDEHPSRKTTFPIPEDVPALIAPVPDLTSAPRNVSFLGYTIILFDLDFITAKLIPALAEKYFTSGSDVDYNLRVVTRSDPKRIIYESPSNTLHNNDAADATSNIFGLRLEMPAVIEQTLGREPQPKIDAKQNKVTVQVFDKRMKEGKETGKGTRVTLMAAEGARWQAALQHRTGSLDLAVASARRKNLIISFTVLVLLTASVALIITSARRAQRLARQQMEFVAGVSHELKTPLAVIRSAGENLADGFIDDREQVRRYGSLIESEGRRLTEMIEQALEFAGIQRGRRSYELRPVDVQEVIESSLAACRPLIEEGAFEITREVERDLPPVAADQPALGQAIENLLANAMKYSGEGRRVKISARKTDDEKQVLITVEDEGIGIPQSELPHVFEPFYRGREAVAAQIHGNGLGLSLVKHIIEAHGGRVTVGSAPGKGSSFELRLPVTAPADNSRRRQVELSTGTKP